MKERIEKESSPRASGAFIVLEGIDGSGTTTQAKALVQYLQRSSRDARFTHEPSRGPLGRVLRDALAGKLGRELDWASLALLFAADRVDHVRTEVEPALAVGAVVVSDRYDLSSLAYQSATSFEGTDIVPWLVQLNARVRRPDLTVVVDLDPRLAAARRAVRGGPEELFERKELQTRLADIYARAEGLVPGDRLVHVDGSGSFDVVRRRILAAVEDCLSG